MGKLRHKAKGAVMELEATIGGPEKVGNDEFKWGTLDDYLTFRQVWLSHWTVDGQTLKSAFDAAQANSNWASPTVYGHALSIFGYQTLHYNEYNKRSDWP
ncbi:MAG: hypothetical protein JWM04_1898 [Verrucomicrobiales bacterium]|nr:hypothetical protein [Verrucomicrobiales bacterium]